jgi:hypothetical protein
MATDDRVNFCRMNEVIAFSLLWLLVCARQAPRRVKYVPKLSVTTGRRQSLPPRVVAAGNVI